VKLDSTFTIDAPMNAVWATILDVPTVAPCVPGARVVSQLADDAYQVAVKVKVGPIAMEYRGQLQIVERDDTARRAVMRGKAKEARGQGAAQATVDLRLTDTGSAVRGDITADVQLSGRAAAMGQGVLRDVTGQLVDQFARNLAELLHSRQTAPVGPPDESMSGPNILAGVDVATADSAYHPTMERDESPEQIGRVIGDDVGAARAANGAAAGPTPGSGSGRTDVTLPEAPVSGGAQSSPGGRGVDRIAAGQRPQTFSLPESDDADDSGASLNAAGLVRSVVVSRLRDPRVGVPLAVVAVLLLARIRRRRPEGRLTVAEFERLVDIVEQRLAARG
jgi:carbon monoxide dehydrogenase subunit G